MLRLPELGWLNQIPSHTAESQQAGSVRVDPRRGDNRKERPAQGWIIIFDIKKNVKEVAQKKEKK